jgi:predicted porin
MKKTIIAAAIAASVAAPAAFADVKISGMVAPEWVSSDDNTAQTGAVKTDGDHMAVYTDLVVSGSEDLGNGMKASFKYHTFVDQTDDATDATLLTEKAGDMSVAISGDFGTIVAGRFESFAEGTMDAFANIEGINAIDLEAADSVAAARNNSSLAYVSPSFNGLTVGLSSAIIDGDSNEANEVMVKYTNGGLTVMANSTDAAGNDHKMVAVGYKVGDLEIRAMTGERAETAGAANTDYDFVGVKYTMGANVISAGMAEDNDNKSHLVALTHNLSKTTSAYVGYYSNEDGANDDESHTVVGISQKF